MPNSVDRAYFQWDIRNPFLPRREMEATFHYWECQGLPMKVVLEPMNRGINSWEFSLTLAANLKFEESSSLSLSRVVIFIILDNDLVTTKLVPDSHSRGYRFQERVMMKPHTSMHLLTIRIFFDLPARHERWTQHFFNGDDLKCLSNSLKQVLINEEKTNRVVWSKNNTRAFGVHSYIMYWRWNNFFKVHRNQGDIHTNISEIMLGIILVYIYCGELPLFESAHFRQESENYCTELCQVIEHYQLDHLYKVLVKKELRQKRLTVNKAITVSHLFPLEIAENRTISNRSFTWEINTTRICRWDDRPHLAFRIRMRNVVGNWISYSLKSRSTGTVYVDVNLEVVKRLEGGQEATHHVFGQDLAMEPNETVRSGPVLCLSFPETFGHNAGQDGRYFIRCFISVSNAEQVQVMTSVGDKRYQDIIERYGVLSDHMSKLNEQRRYAQMLVKSRPYVQGEIQTTRSIHYEILIARVPSWWRGFANATQGEMPYFPTSRLSRQALTIVFDYIYTGKVTNIPRSCIDEMMHFAEQTGFRCLINLLHRYRRQSINQ